MRGDDCRTPIAARGTKRSCVRKLQSAVRFMCAACDSRARNVRACVQRAREEMREKSSNSGLKTRAGKQDRWLRSARVCKSASARDFRARRIYLDRAKGPQGRAEGGAPRPPHAAPGTRGVAVFPFV